MAAEEERIPDVATRATAEIAPSVAREGILRVLLMVFVPFDMGQC